MVASLLFLSTSTSLLAQPGSRRMVQAVNDAEKMMNQRMYQEAKVILTDVLKVDTSMAKPFVLMGNIAYLDQQFGKAIELYRRYLAKTSHQNPKPYDVILRLCNLEFEAGNYDEAMRICNTLAPDSVSKPEFTLARFTELRKCRWAIKAMKVPNGQAPELMGPPLNSLPLQYLPSLSPDEQQFYFTGRTGQRGSSDEDLYVVDRLPNGWSAPKGISTEVNSPYNEGACTISGDGNTLIFSVCESPLSRTGCDLFMSRRNPDGSWGRPINMDVVNSRYWDSQPSLNADGSELFFASARPGGSGKIDIWVSRLNPEGLWQAPTNLGPVINTPEDEGGPHLHANGKSLFFASKGHIGLGGYDIFVAERDPNGVWAAPLNLGTPLNTQHHESAIFVTAKGTEGYLTRDTKDPPTSHLWQWKVPAWLTSKVACTVLKGKVVSAVDGKPIEAEVAASPPDAKGQVYNVMSNPITGKFTLVLPATKTYELHIGAKGYMFQSWQTNGLERSLPEKTIPLQPIKAATATVLAHIYFPTNGYTILPESEAELRYLAKFLKTNSRTKVNIEGHTDDVGNAADNLSLSQKRAQTVVDYLKAHDIFETRLTAVGYGKSKPVVPNTNEKNRAKNRRINMQITPF